VCPMSLSLAPQTRGYLCNFQNVLSSYAGRYMHMGACGHALLAVVQLLFYSIVLRLQLLAVCTKRVVPCMVESCQYLYMPLDCIMCRW
jgi:hypothetical protein